MRVTIDTNIFGPLVSPADYPGHSHSAEFVAISGHIASGAVHISIAESALSLEALNRHARLDEFFREWATKTSNIQLPVADPRREAIVKQAFACGITVMHVPRIALGSFVAVPQGSWAAEPADGIEKRQERSGQLARDYDTEGFRKLRQLGAQLVTEHALDVSRVPQFPGWPPREEFEWMKGLIAEYDHPKRFPSAEKFSRHVRDIIAEGADVDMVAAHFGYSHDLLCTLDSAKSTGQAGILHPSNHGHLRHTYGVEVVNPTELVKRLSK